MHHPAPQTFAALTLAALTAAALALPCAADPAARPPKPYKPVAIARPAALDDASFTAFRRALSAVAKGRVYVELARLVEPQGFFWERDFGNHFDARKPAVDNLAAAIRLEQSGGIGWDSLLIVAGEAAVEPLESRTGVVCAPARPRYDSIAFARLLDETNSGDEQWRYPRADETPVRGAPQADAAAIGRLATHFVRLAGFERAGADEALPERNFWARIVTPAGRLGYVAPNSLVSLGAARLCYGKDIVGRWHIAGFIAGVN